MWKKMTTAGRAANFLTNSAKQGGRLLGSPALSKKIPSPGTVDMVRPPKAGFKEAEEEQPKGELWPGFRSENGARRSFDSALHCVSLPKRQRVKIEARMKASMSVNQAPSGTFSNTDERNAPSRAAKTSQIGRTT
jgi:hypothetical protein